MIQCLANHYDIDVETPFQDLPEDFQQTVLYGSHEEQIEFIYLSERGNSPPQYEKNYPSSCPQRLASPVRVFG